MVVCCPGRQNRKFGEVIAALKAGKISLDGSVFRVFPFADTIEAFQRIDSFGREIRKATLSFE
jgi:threonine dehydrogenase-like Zn-dependent dehydrogenase